MVCPAPPRPAPPVPALRRPAPARHAPRRNNNVNNVKLERTSFSVGGGGAAAPASSRARRAGRVWRSWGRGPPPHPGPDARPAPAAAPDSGRCQASTLGCGRARARRGGRANKRAADARGRRHTHTYKSRVVGGLAKSIVSLMSRVWAAGGRARRPPAPTAAPLGGSAVPGGVKERPLPRCLQARRAHGSLSRGAAARALGGWVWAACTPASSSYKTPTTQQPTPNKPNKRNSRPPATPPARPRLHPSMVGSLWRGRRSGGTGASPDALTPTRCEGVAGGDGGDGGGGGGGGTWWRRTAALATRPSCTSRLGTSRHVTSRGATVTAELNTNLLPRSKQRKLNQDEILRRRRRGAAARRRLSPAAAPSEPRREEAPFGELTDRLTD
ncbi:hypothetical protein E2C01_052799 [Portunus trituberculatus]|uniref:Uncharacterized protein n=1 Tax=Portunus trituberculatus TaxID=210409 RepID=A0A5B7GEN3_PORTR|nr:hypothetical protein [Portunus trituberculatus]